MHQGGWMFMGWTWIFWLLVIVALAMLAVALMRGFSRSDGGSRRQESPEEILKRRYANGEIEREEYQRRLEDLRR
jgi:putative membrane protein